MRNLLRNQPLFLLLLPVFFVLHGCLENYPFIPFRDAVFLILFYFASSVILAILVWLLFRHTKKAALLSFSLMAFHFFFGSLHDGLQKTTPGTFFSRYSFILPAAALFFILLLIRLKKTQKPLHKIVFFFNLLFLLLITTDTVQLAVKANNITKKSLLTKLPEQKRICDSCAKPDVYFILLDEYAGNTELKNLFTYDNTPFENELRQRGFYVTPNSQSNYNYTPFSVASTLNISYLPLKDTNRSGADLNLAYETIRDSRMYHFFTGNGYTFYNFSVFDFEGQPARTHETFLPSRTRLITAQTFLSRMEKDILFNVITRFRSKAAQKKLTYYNRDNNERVYRLTFNKAAEKEPAPRFIYTHLMMPHYPYYYDKNGKEREYEELQEGKQVQTAGYTGYLQYANGKILSLVDHILKNAARPPVIILLGDHGFRHFEQPVERKYYFLNLQAVLLPSKNYSGFREGLSNINLFPLVLNNQFNAAVPLLPDSAIYLKD